MIYEFKYEGKTYEFDDERMSIPEARYVKAHSGMSGMRFFRAASELDPDCLLAILVLAMRRAGEKADVEDIYRGDENGYFKLISSVDVRESSEKKVDDKPAEDETTEEPKEEKAPALRRPRKNLKAQE